MDDDGNLDYVPEEEYTEEFEMSRRRRERNRAFFHAHK